MQNFLAQLLQIPTALAQSNTAEKATSASSNMFGFVFENLPLWITAVVFFVASLVVGAILKSVVENRIAKKITDEHEEVLIISGRLTFVAVVVIGGSISLAIAGINITNLIAAIGFGISFGLQDTIANFVAGIALLASRPFTIGDWISINGKMGKVTQIRVRATYLDTFDGIRLIVPNSQLYKSQVMSYTSNPMRRLKVAAYTRYNVDMQQAFAICLNVVKAHNDILLQPKASVVVTEMGDYYIALQIRFWVDSKSLWRRIQSRVFMEIQNKFVEAGIDAPYPTTAVGFDTDDDQSYLKTKSLDAEDVNKIMKARTATTDESDKKRAELSKLAPPPVIPLTVDQSGASFLKAEPSPIPTEHTEHTEPPQEPPAAALVN